MAAASALKRINYVIYYHKINILLVLGYVFCVCVWEENVLSATHPFLNVCIYFREYII